MKKSAYKITFHLYAIFFIVIISAIFLVIAMLLFLLKSNISHDNNYANWSSWPIAFTNNFSREITFEANKPKLTQAAIKELDKYKLSMQIMDKNGDVVTSYNVQEGAALHYSPIEIVDMFKTGGNLKGYTAFVGSINNNDEKWTYVIAFPVKILKVTMYLNYDNASKLKFIIFGLLAVIMLLILAAGAAYGLWINHVFSDIINCIKRITKDTYFSMKGKGIYSDVYESLNLLDSKLKASEAERKRNEALREDWIANISHDLKTPLSPIKGYAELLADSEYTVLPEDIKKYGEIILRNTKNVENLVENLNFTYKLKNGMLPINKKNENLVRLLKEIIINILNDPKYEDRNITFNSNVEKINFSFDNELIQRAFNNLIYNAIVHNDKNTVIKISIKREDKIYVKIEDNGKGMEKDELEKLFERYYRGTSSQIKVEGSGLGMAIAKQIIEAHDGKIYVESTVNEGTCINIEFVS